MTKFDSVFDYQELDEVRRELAWEVKLHLDGLPTHADRLQYWLDTFGDFRNIEEVFDWGRSTEFRLSLKPQSDEEKRLQEALFYEAWLNHDRAIAVTEGDFVGQYNTVVTTSKVKTVETLKKEFEDEFKSLGIDSSKKQFVKSKLEEVTETITIVQESRSKNVHVLIKELRRFLNRSDTFDSKKFIRHLFDKEKLKEELERKNPSLEKSDFFSKGIYKILLLANIWDIIHFEHYLTDKLAKIERNILDENKTGKIYNQIGSSTEQDSLSNKAKTEDQLRQPARALYWIYLWLGGCVTAFSNHPEGKVKAIKELVGDKKSYKNFQQHYNIYEKTCNRVSVNNINRIESILHLLLEKCPKAHAIASDDLKVACGKLQGKALT